jgi:PAS domain S-box-containing protein
MLRPDPPSGARVIVAPAVGLAIVAGITAYDIGADTDSIVIGTVVLGAFVTALLGSPFQTALVAAAAAACALASGTWHDSFGDAPYVLRLTVVLIGGLVAFVAATGRRQHEIQRAAFALLTSLSRTVDEPMTPAQTVNRIEQLLVPSIADICTIDVVRGNDVVRLSVKAIGDDAAEIEELVRERPVNAAASGVGSTVAIVSEQPQLFHHSDELLQRSAVDAADLALLRRLDISSTAVLPLRTRGRVLGALSVGMRKRSGRRYRESDLDFLKIVAGRVALALDNAGLSQDIRELEHQLRIALGDLTDAVTVTDADGRTVYANPVALELLGFETEDELYAAEPETVMARYEITDERGAPLDVEALPSSRLRSGERHVEPLLVRNVVRATGEERWLINKTSPVFDEDGEIVRIVNVIENVTELKREERASDFVARASDILASSLDYEQTLQRVADLVVPELADWCGVSLPDGRGTIRTVAVAHQNPDKVALARRLADTYPEDAGADRGAALVIRSGESQLVNVVPDELLVQSARDPEHLALLRELGLHAGMVVPLRDSHGSPIGALTFVSAESKRTFDRHDLALAEELGRRAGIAVENSRLYSERSEIATTLQKALLPDQLPEIPGLVISDFLRPVGQFNDVGGDFYDAFETSGGWMFIVGDVMGHGAEAARVTATARATFRAIGKLTGDLATTVGRLNEALCAEPQLTIVTLVCLMLRPSGGRGATSVEIICAGHPRPIKVTRDGASDIAVAGPMLGWWDEASWTTASVELAAGDSLVLYTDGVTDVIGSETRFGQERLLACLDRPDGGPEEIIEGVVERIDAFRAHPQTDDEAILVLQCRPERPPLGAGTDADEHEVTVL